MVLNVEEAKQKTIELIQQNSYSHFRPQFSKYSTIYPDTTENLSYLEQMDIKDKEVLTVTGSFDQCLNLACFGAKKVHNIDTNVLSVFYSGFKYAMVEAFSYQEYLSFFKEENRFDYQMYLKLRPYLGTPFQEYWDFVYQIFSYSGRKMAKSNLFSGFTPKENFILMNPYLKSEENYERMKENLHHMKITFAEENILEIGEKKETYDLMFFSNVETYLVEDVEHCMSKEEYLNFLQNKASKQLKPGGKIQCAYQYFYQYPRLEPLPKNKLKRFFTSKYSLKKIDYMEGKCKKIVFTGSPLKAHTTVDENIKDCIYLYEEPKGRRR